MDPAVNFDDKAELVAVKIRDETMYYLLTAEMKAIDLISPCSIPETFLGKCHLPAKCLCDLELFVVYFLAVN